jgi:hypothetical protein
LLQATKKPTRGAERAGGICPAYRTSVSFGSFASGHYLESGLLWRPLERRGYAQWRKASHAVINLLTWLFVIQASWIILIGTWLWIYIRRVSASDVNILERRRS